MKVKELPDDKKINYLQSNEYQFDLYRQLGGKKSHFDIKKQGGYTHHMYLEELCRDLVKNQAMVEGTNVFVRDYNKGHEGLDISANLDEDELKDLLDESEIKELYNDRKEAYRHGLIDFYEKYNAWLKVVGSEEVFEERVKENVEQFAQYWDGTNKIIGWWSEKSDVAEKKYDEEGKIFDDEDKKTKRSIDNGKPSSYELRYEKVLKDVSGDLGKKWKKALMEFDRGRVLNQAIDLCLIQIDRLVEMKKNKEERDLELSDIYNDFIQNYRENWEFGINKLLEVDAREEKNKKYLLQSWLNFHEDTISRKVQMKLESGMTKVDAIVAQLSSMKKENEIISDKMEKERKKIREEMKKKLLEQSLKSQLMTHNPDQKKGFINNLWRKIVSFTGYKK